MVKVTYFVYLLIFGHGLFNDVSVIGFGGVSIRFIDFVVVSGMYSSGRTDLPVLHNIFWTFRYWEVSDCFQNKVLLWLVESFRITDSTNHNSASFWKLSEFTNGGMRHSIGNYRMRYKYILTKDNACDRITFVIIIVFDVTNNSSQYFEALEYHHIFRISEAFASHEMLLLY